MIGPGAAGTSFNAYAYGYDSGLAGTLVVRIYDANDNLILGPVTTPITEVDLGGEQSAYRYVGTFPAPGEYVIIWEDPDGDEAVEEIFSVEGAEAIDVGPGFGPCTDWIDSDDVAACCGIEPSSDSQADLETAATMASQLMYRLTARKFSGLCVSTIRPCRSGCACSHNIEEGWNWRGNEWVRSDGRACGCGCVSQVTLSGPVRAIVEVKVDGAVVGPSLYRVDEFKYLVRLPDEDGSRAAWPRCQSIDLPSTEPGTFEVTYMHGIEPPLSGVSAAAALACELFNACPSGQGECKLPAGVTRIIRQGLVIEKVDSLAMMLRKGATGIIAIDTFMAAFNPTGAMLGPMVWSPDLPPHRKVG